VADRDPELKAAVESAAPAEPMAVPRANRMRRGIIMVSVPVLIVIALGTWYVLSLGKVSTDNAYVRQDKVGIAPLINGNIVEIAVHENQMVKAGDLLFRIDPAPYKIALAQANAQLAAAQARLVGLHTDLSVTGADIAGAQEDVNFYAQDLKRESELMSRGFSTRARMDAAEHALDDARSKLADAQGTAAKARAAMATGQVAPGVDPAVLAAQVAQQKAQLDLSHTEVRAPVSGKVSQVSRLQIGQLALLGLNAMTIVRSDASWVEANFKETDLADMRVGQPATVSFDAYPDVKLRGHVASIGAGTGSEFSLLPAQNANGNWVKVTQRVPVRIAIDQVSPRPLIAGISTDVVVYTRRR